MVYHFGIDPQRGEVTVYDAKIKIAFDFTVTRVTQNDIKKIDIMFDEISKNYKKELGCACFYLSFVYDNKFRKRLIEAGKKYGFKELQIIDFTSFLYFYSIIQSGYIPREGDIIWIMYSGNCFMWKIHGKKARKLRFLTGVTEDLFEIKKNLSGFDKQPNLIIYNSCSTPDIINQCFPSCLYFKMDKRWRRSKFATIKARIMADDLEVIEYDAETSFDRILVVGKNGKTLPELCVNEFESLPYIMTIDMEPDEGNVFELTINDNVYAYYPIPLQLCELTIIVDVNGIFFVSYRSQLDPRSIYDIEPEMEMEIEAEKENINCNFFVESREIYESPPHVIYLVEDSPYEVGTDLITPEYYDAVNPQFWTNDFSPFTQCFVSKKSNPFLGSYVIPKKMRPNDNINAVGIDLGTSRCFAAVNRRNGIETIPLDNAGERPLPSYVSFENNNELCGQIVVNRLQNYSQLTVFDNKRIIGRDFADVKIDPIWPFKVFSTKDGKPMIKIQQSNKSMDKSPEEITAILLKHIKQKAEEIQGKEMDEVVITVPTAFNENQQIATRLAGLRAKWKTIHLIPEPIAASIAYFIDRPIPNEFIMLLFDFGGGTLDVCIVKIMNERLKILNIGDNENLGGRDFDNILFNYFSEILDNRYGINVNVKDRLKYLLMQKCMAIKHTLSSTDEDLLHIGDFNPNIEETLKITRQEFEKLAQRSLAKVKEALINILSNASFLTNDIHKILLVGGSSRMPMIRELLRNMFPKAEHSCDEHPDEVVAIGAAYYAYYLASKKS